MKMKMILSLKMYDSTLCHKTIWSSVQVRTVFSKMNKLYSLIKDSESHSRNQSMIQKSESHKSMLKEPVGVCIKPKKEYSFRSSSISSERYGSVADATPLLRSGLTNTSAIGGVVSSSGRRVALGKIVQDSSNVIDFSIGERSLLDAESRRMRSSSSGLKCLDPSISMNMNMNILHRKKRAVPQILSDVVLSSPIFLSDISLFVSIFIGILFHDNICLTHLISEPLALFCKLYPALKESLRDVYVNNMCLIHKKPSPCECGDLFNQTVMDQLPQFTYDPLDLHDLSPSKKVLTLISTLGGMILLMVFLEKTGGTEMFQDASLIKWYNNFLANKKS